MREDLRALTDEALAAIANLGLLKRARRENASGLAPAIEESPDGTVTGRFPDGTVTSLPPGRALAQAPCSCPSISICRHRVAVVLAYRDLGLNSSKRDGPTEGQQLAIHWSPGEIDDAELKSAIGARPFERARALARGGLVATIERAPAIARLPASTVRFLVPREIAHARCDCARGQGCEHVALAVFAFREADRRDRSAPRLTVEIGRAHESGGEALATALALGREVLANGAVHAPASLARRTRLAREALEREGLTWPALVVGELEAALDAYRTRSARYTPGQLAELLAELAARERAARTKGELPRRSILGLDEAPETRLDQVRLVSLGARVLGPPGEPEVTVSLADPLGGVLVVEKSFDSSGVGLFAARSIARGLKVGEVSRGTLTTRAARRRANRELVLGSGPLAATSVSTSADWSTLPAPLLVADFASLERELSERAPRLLRPRVKGDLVRVLAVASVGAVTDSPGEQLLRAELLDAKGRACTLARRFTTNAPLAGPVLARALLDRDRPVRFVSGEVRGGERGLEIDPIAVVSDRLIVPDLEPVVDERERVPVGGESGPRSAIADALAPLARALEDVAHAGLDHARGAPPKLRDAAARLEDAGLERLARLAAELARAMEALDRDAAARAWESAAIRVSLALELV